MTFDDVIQQYGKEGDAETAYRLGQQLEADGDLRKAASAYDRAFGLAPQDEAISTARERVLDALAIVEHGMAFRYIPAGTFLMGSEDGDPDERPAHPVYTDGFWLAETCLNWEDYCRLAGYEPPPSGLPDNFTERFTRSIEAKNMDRRLWHLKEATKVRNQYSSNEEDEGRWLSMWRPEGTRYDTKPMVAVDWAEADEFCDLISTDDVTYRLSTEAEWEKAARGGLINQRYVWGDAPISSEHCDYDRFDELTILPMKHFAPNNYGLYAMNGSVWEWTRDWYDSHYYAESPLANPQGPTEGKQKVLRGGAWCDPPNVISVAFRMGIIHPFPHRFRSPTIGMRLCRVETH